MTLYMFFLLTGVLLFAGLPVTICLALPTLYYVLAAEHAPAFTVLHSMVQGVNSFTLLAVPFFILAGNLMNAANITDRIFNFAKAAVGFLPGGLGHVNVGASVIFAGMSGAAVADAGGLGAIEIRAMRDAGYDDDFSVGITAASSTIGPIIPPSLPLIIYGVIASESIGKLFLAGVVPGFLMAASLMIMIHLISKKRGYHADASFSWRVLGKSFCEAFLSLMTPVIIIGGILFGVFTPTEAAIVASFYAFFLGSVVYKTITWKKLVQVSLDSLETTSSVLFIVASASAYAWILTTVDITDALAAGISSISPNAVTTLLLITGLVLFVGCFMETVAAITILVPVLLPIVVAAGIDPAHFGIMLVLNLMLGLLTPPVGVVLYVLSKVAKIPFELCVRGTAPFLIPLVIVLLLVTFVPALSMWLPNLILG